MIGTFNLQTAEKLAGVLHSLNYEKACTVHSEDGYDEFSPFSSNFIFEVGSDIEGIKQLTYQPEEMTIKKSDEFIEGADSTVNAKITRDVLSGEKGPARDMTALNAAFAFYIAGKSKTVEEGIKYAEDILDSGAGIKKLNEYVEMSNGCII